MQKRKRFIYYLTAITLLCCAGINAPARPVNDTLISKYSFYDFIKDTGFISSLRYADKNYVTVSRLAGEIVKINTGFSSLYGTGETVSIKTDTFNHLGLRVYKCGFFADGGKYYTRFVFISKAAMVSFLMCDVWRDGKFFLVLTTKSNEQYITRSCYIDEKNIGTVTAYLQKNNWDISGAPFVNNNVIHESRTDAIFSGNKKTPKEKFLFWSAHFSY